MSTMALEKLKIILTRSTHQIETSAKDFEELGAHVIRASSIRLAEPPTSDDQVYNQNQWLIPKTKLSRELWRFDWIIFTSVNAVKHAELAWQDIGGLKSALNYQAHVKTHLIKKRQVACIGQSTKNYLESMGIDVDLQPKEFHAESLLVELKSVLANKDLNQIQVLIPRALVARELLPNSLREMGVTVWITPLYQTLTEDLSSQCKQHICQYDETINHRAIVFTSNSTMKGFVEQFSATQLNEIKQRYDTFVIGPVIRQAALNEGFRVVAMAQPHNMAGMINTVLNYYSTMEA